MFTANIGKIFLDVHNGRRRGNSPSAARGKFWLNVTGKKKKIVRAAICWIMLSGKLMNLCS